MSYPSSVGKKKSLWTTYGTGILFSLPFLTLFLIFVVVPVILSIILSFTNYDMLQAPKFVGFNNYKLLFLDDEVFALAFRNTIVFSCIAGPLSFVFSFLMAWILNGLKMRNFFALLFYAPSITSSIALSTVWLYFFSPDRYGLVNDLLLNLGVIDSPVLWNQDANTIMPIVILIYIWMGMGQGFLVFLAGLQNVQQELYEAGKIDGIKSAFQELFYITLPQMKPQLLFAAITSVVSAFSVFDIINGFAGLPSPNYAGQTILIHLYDYAFIRFEMGYASAVAVILFGITFIIGQVLLRVLSSRREN